jgi:hypothetical protein
LPDGIDIEIELITVEAGSSVGISDAQLDAPGESALVNETGHLHNHPMWQIAAPGGEQPEPRQISFRLHGDGFDSSEIITVTLELYEGQDGGEHD